MSNNDPFNPDKDKNDTPLTEDANVSQSIVANTGSIIQNVTQTITVIANEKPLKRFGIEQRLSTLVLAFLILSAVTISTFIILRAFNAPESTRMSGSFRIAVANFVWNGEGDFEDIATDLSEELVSQLTSSFPVTSSITIWGPDQVEAVTDLIEGANDAEYQEAVARIATDIGADIIIYGVIDVRQTPWQATPYFYLADTNLPNAFEITGPYAMGHAFTLADIGSPTILRTSIVNGVTPRVSLLSQITIGVSNYALGEYESALATFLALENNDAWVGIGGKEILYLLIGNAYGKNNELTEAEIAYLRSQELNPDYARSYIGLASLYYVRALEPILQSDGSQDPTKADVTLLREALAYYELALEKQDPSLVRADIQTKVDFGMGQVYMMLHFAGEESSFQTAVAKFEAVIRAYNDGENGRVRELAAEAHARLGLIYRVTGSVDKAIEEYETAAALWSYNPVQQNKYMQIVTELKR